MAMCFVLLLLDFLPFFSSKIAIWYYFITDRVKAGELNIEYSPIGDMVADYSTKPLQGKKFYQFRKEIMNLKD